MTEKSAIKKFWKFIWESNSIWSWILSLVLVFVVIMGIFFPALRLILSTPLPMVVIESGSMEHASPFDQWYESCNWYSEHNITKDEIKNWNFYNGLYKGDIMIVQGQKEYKKGDVIIFKAQQTKPIIHRIISADEKYSTKGDNNCYQLPQELSIEKEQIIGKAVARIPALGWVKLIGADMLSIFKIQK